MKQESIELLILFKEEYPSSKDLIDYFEKEISDLFNIQFHEISYNLKAGSSLRGKTLKFKQRNIEKFVSQLPNNFDGGGFGLINYLPDFKFKSTDINLSVSYRRGIFDLEHSSIKITLNKTFFYSSNQNHVLVSVCTKTIAFLKSIQKRITYGFIFSMANEKFPGFFAEGIGNNNLTNEEESAVQTWAEKNHESDSKIWRIFWGNLITKKHLKSGTSIEDVKRIVGDENVYLVSDNTYFFNLPDTDLSYGNENKRKGKKLLNILNSFT